LKSSCQAIENCLFFLQPIGLNDIGVKCLVLAKAKPHEPGVAVVLSVLYGAIHPSFSYELHEVLKKWVPKAQVKPRNGVGKPKKCSDK